MGNVIQAARARGLPARGTDLVRRSEIADVEMDFLRDPCHITNPSEWDLVTNPPYGKGVTALAFILRGMELGFRTVNVFVGETFLFSMTRKPFFERHPPRRIAFMSRRPSCPPGGRGIEATGGQANYVWLTFGPGVGGLTWLGVRPPRKRS